MTMRKGCCCLTLWIMAALHIMGVAILAPTTHKVIVNDYRNPRYKVSAAYIHQYNSIPEEQQQEQTITKKKNPWKKQPYGNKDLYHHNHHKPKQQKNDQPSISSSYDDEDDEWDDEESDDEEPLIADKVVLLDHTTAITNPSRRKSIQIQIPIRGILRAIDNTLSAKKPASKKKVTFHKDIKFDEEERGGVRGQGITYTKSINHAEHNHKVNFGDWKAHHKGMPVDDDLTMAFPEIVLQREHIRLN